MMVARFGMQTRDLTLSLLSPTIKLSEEDCLTINYQCSGVIYFIVVAGSNTNIVNEGPISLENYWKKADIPLPAGTYRIIFNATAKGTTFGLLIKSIKLNGNSCISQTGNITNTL